MKANHLTVEFYADRALCWRWRIVASNGRKVACSGEAFASKSNAQRALRSFLSYDLAVQLDERTK